MKTIKKISTLFLIILVFASSACTQDETMDDILGNTEISNPSNTNDGADTDSPSDGG